MLIVAACPECGRRYDVAGHLAGKKVRCKDCSAQFRVPRPVTLRAKSRAAPQAGPDLMSDLDLAELPAILPPPPPPRDRSRLGWLVVAFALALIIGTIAWSFLVADAP